MIFVSSLAPIAPEILYNGTVRNLLSCFVQGVLVSVALAFGLGCRDEAPSVPVSPLRVEMVFSQVDNPIWDRHGDAVGKRLKHTYAAEISYVLAQSSVDRRSVLNAGGSQAVDLVVCVGPQFDRAIHSEGPRFPQTAFVVDRGDILAPNVARMEFLQKGAAYLGGVAAAILGGSTVGIIEGDVASDASDVEAGFEQGFRRRNPWGGRIERASDPDGIQELADKGVTVALYAAVEPDPLLLEAAERSGLQLLTISENNLEKYPNVMVAAIVFDLAEAVSRIAADVVDDTFIGRVYAFDLGSGVVDLMLHPDLAENQALAEALDQARAAVNAGMVEIEALGL